MDNQLKMYFQPPRYGRHEGFNKKLENEEM